MLYNSEIHTPLRVYSVMQSTFKFKIDPMEINHSYACQRGPGKCDFTAASVKRELPIY